jgi:hypothetical protein
VHPNITSGNPNELRTQGPTTPFKNGTTVTGKKKERMTADLVLVVATFLRVSRIRQYMYHDKSFLVLGYLVNDTRVRGCCCLEKHGMCGRWLGKGQVMMAA